MKKFWINHYIFLSNKTGRVRRYDVHEVKKDGTRGKIACTIDDQIVDNRMDWEELHEKISQLIKDKFDWKWWPGILGEKKW